MKTLIMLNLALLVASNSAPSPTPTISKDLRIRQTTTTTTKSTCIKSGIHLMVAGGCAQPCPTDNPSLLEPLVNKTLTHIHGSDLYIVPYNNSNNQVAVSTPLMIQAVNAYHASCPQVPIVLLGYSLGGVIVMNTLCGGISSSLASQVIAAVAYGEETFLANKTYNRGTCIQNAPLYPRGNAAQCLPFTPVLHSYCDADDLECCEGGTSASAHYAYPGLYDKHVFSFFRHKYSSYTSKTARMAATSTHAATETATTP